MASIQLQKGVIFLLSLLNISTARSGASNLLSRLLKQRTEPVILVLDKPKSHFNFIQQQESNDDDLLSIQYSTEVPDDDHYAYLLYKLLRTIQAGEELEDSVEDKFESTKQALRQGPLRARCQTLTICIEECPKQKPKCPVKCQEKYDDWGACGEKKPKKKKDDCVEERGRTMPPKWLLRIL